MEQKYILLVEPYENLLECYKTLLGTTIHEALCINSYYRAQQELSKHQYHLLITAMNLGEGLSGKDLADEALVIQPPIQVLFVTGGTAYRFKADDHVLWKPFSPITFLQMVDRILEQSAPTRLSVMEEKPDNSPPESPSAA